ncbi:MAG: DUF2442 domain-containing protein [Acidobacteriota bacterium]|jgi:general stress protein YciG|nr:DUF2442 domain-containing protein [Acidobacteriota bacterium]MDQ3373499.1 DUF2442 domain-containing protein [Acidobacteriota bacterium]
MAKVKLGKFEVDESDLERQHLEAVKRGRETLEALPKAASAKYDKKSKRLILHLKTGTTLLVPINLIQGLQTEDDQALSDFDLMLEGSQIHWHKLDAQFYIKSLLEGIFGTRKWMDDLNEHLSAIGRKGGASRSDAKRRASAENGRKGGRPRKKQIA